MVFPRPIAVRVTPMIRKHLEYLADYSLKNRRSIWELVQTHTIPNFGWYEFGFRARNTCLYAYAVAIMTLAGCPSGQWEGTVNPPALPSKVQILHPPPVMMDEPSILPLARQSHYRLVSSKINAGTGCFSGSVLPNNPS